MTRRTLRAALLAAALSTLAPAPASAADTPVVFARASYWDGFKEFWVGRVKRQEGVVLVALGVAAVSLFIITRAKAKK